MKKVSHLNKTEDILKPRKGLKLFSALAMTAPVFLDSGQKAFAVQHLAGGLPKTITVKDKSMGQSSMAVVTTRKRVVPKQFTVASTIKTISVSIAYNQ